ncbi:MAG: Enoyl-CoA hydratase [Candidatus Magnetoglobus multicellularis str. Araruama]|uniref:Enoyl-CoA hydratase n=1 Tax=Candidatus Magnetoglobus multicellularis str. Araruama TaxID=890399 RepID=A0A1V1PHS5_9BACT|nr:MAG: Enoyl-CoA hydratase [Candidatus Magnetoglobus multicellularis str. Araruama]
MKDQDLTYKVRNSVAWITINRVQQRNAINTEVIQLFLQALDQAKEDDHIRAVCITGCGDKAFCSGADLGGQMGSCDATTLQDSFNKYSDLLYQLYTFPKPTVAKINGYCLAGGTGFMLASDIVIARSDTRFGTPEVNVGLFPMMIGALIFRNVPRKKAMEMVLLGEKLNAQQALDMGLLTRIVPYEQLDYAVEKVLKQLCEKSPLGIKIGKQAFVEAEQMPLKEAIAFLSQKLIEVTSTEDAVEGISAFLEKRPPNFKGR